MTASRPNGHRAGNAAALVRVTEDANLAASLGRLAAAGRELLDACRSSSATVIAGGRAVTMAATDDVATSLDRAQYVVDDGPCLSSAREERVIRLDDLGVPGPWPAFRDDARRLGIVSSLSMPLVLEHDHSSGALNLYGSRAFSDDDERLAAAFAADASIVVSNVVAYWTVLDLSRNLAAALEHRGVIEQAKGILMASRGCSPDEAFDVLRRRSQADNRKLRDVAADVVATSQRRAPR